MSVQRLSVAAVYYACKMNRRGRSLAAVKVAFGVDVSTAGGGSDAWDERIIECWRKALAPTTFKGILLASSEDDLLTRMVYRVPESVIAANHTWPVLKTARKLAAIVAPRIPAVKPSKLNVTLIYIACKTAIGTATADIAAELVKEFDVSVATMKKHERLVQQILVGG